MVTAIGNLSGESAGPQAGRRGLFAALDLGTNNCRLLVARPAGDSLHVIDAFSRLVRLGEGFGLNGSLSRPGLGPTHPALPLFAPQNGPPFLAGFPGGAPPPRPPGAEWAGL